MGVNFTAMFSNRLPDIIDFPLLLGKYEIFQDENTESNGVKWKWISIYDNPNLSIAEIGCASLHGNRGIKFEAGTKLIELSCGFRWIDFLEDKRVQHYVRLECFKLYPFLGHPIYIPQSFDCIDYLMDGYDMYQLKEVLIHKYGRQANSYLNLYDKELDYINRGGFSGYYIDEFADLAR